MTNGWTEIMTAEQINATHALTASLDLRFAAANRKFYETRTATQLRSLTVQAWNSNEQEAYCLARSYLALTTDERASDRGEC